MWSVKTAAVMPLLLWALRPAASEAQQTDVEYLSFRGPNSTAFRQAEFRQAFPTVGGIRLADCGITVFITDSSAIPRLRQVFSPALTDSLGRLALQGGMPERCRSGLELRFVAVEYTWQRMDDFARAISAGLDSIFVRASVWHSGMEPRIAVVAATQEGFHRAALWIAASAVPHHLIDVKPRESRLEVDGTVRPPMQAYLAALAAFKDRHVGWNDSLKAIIVGSRIPADMRKEDVAPLGFTIGGELCEVDLYVQFSEEPRQLVDGPYVLEFAHGSTRSWGSTAVMDVLCDDEKCSVVRRNELMTDQVLICNRGDAPRTRKEDGFIDA